MKIPSFDAMRTQAADDGIRQSYARHLHPNPKLYKYRWWIFWLGSSCDGHAFLGDEHSLCTADAMALIDKLWLKNERHWIYNRRIPRDHPGTTPFDRSSIKWRNTQFALPFNKDTDPEWEGLR